MFFCEFCEISKNTFFTEHLWTTASIHGWVVAVWLKNFKTIPQIKTVL